MRSKLSTASSFLALLSLIPASYAELAFDPSKPNTIRDSAKIVAENLVGEYKNQDPLPAGLLRDYDFFEAGLFFNSLMDYAAWTGDGQFNDLFEKDFFAQIGDSANFIPVNQTSITNDGVGYWALAAMSAAEYGAKPDNKNSPEYLTLADNVFNDFVNRWDDKTCGGGLRWGIYSFSNGYSFKDSTSNGIFFQLAARLGHQTGNKTYLDWADKVYEWSTKSGIVDSDVVVAAGASVQDNCEKVDEKQYSANLANYIYGSAVMFNATKSKTWKSRTMDGVSYASANFFGPTLYVDDGTSQVVVEPTCEQAGTDCSKEVKAGRSVLFRSLALASVYEAISGGIIQTPILNSARSAARSCNSEGECSAVWTSQTYDAAKGSGVGEKMAALSAFVAVLRDMNPAANKTVFENVQTSEPSTTDAEEAGASQTSELSSSPTTGAPSSASRVLVGGLLGAIGAVSFLQMLL